LAGLRLLFYRRAASLIFPIVRLVIIRRSNISGVTKDPLIFKGLYATEDARVFFFPKNECLEFSFSLFAASHWV
jgi:hypothetical protein